MRFAVPSSVLSQHACMNQHELFTALKPSNKPRRLLVRLRGRWLQDAGFVIVRHVNIEVSEGRMMIEQVD